MKIVFQNSIRRFEFFVPSTGHQNCLDKSLAPEIYEMFVYKHTETIEYVKK